MTAVARNEVVRELYNGTIQSLKTVVPIPHEVGSPQKSDTTLSVKFGVLIGITGDIKGRILLKADPSIFSSIGEVMFGMPLEGEMLSSFSGELGNMIAGSLSTTIASKGITTDITYPTVMEGDTKLSGFNNSLLVTIDYGTIGKMELYLLLNN
ncbi:chemotaxis protein CheX [Radiobacillus kanasensis]|uniref:chemotaxis protein CheX n=1 Tax=Radiobacillus kanasensis TaxID=2844358 RepID=UPI001E4FDB5A|nr:chemotaxis protein CheX [Radiobacillus kanasensis]UFT98278.1 chemotaxis protein CheX [Radiobacillus kanasensis]